MNAITTARPSIAPHRRSSRRVLGLSRLSGAPVCNASGASRTIRRRRSFVWSAAAVWCGCVLRGYPETTLGKTVYLLDSERISHPQRSALLC